MKPIEVKESPSFQNRVSWQGARRGVMTLDAHLPVAIGSPPVFKGDADVWCPEELLIGAVNSCLMLTFLALARNQQLEVLTYTSSAEGTLEKVEGKYRLTRIAVQPVVTLRSQEDIARAQSVFKDTKQACIISNSVIAKVDLRPELEIGKNSAGE